MLQLSDYPSCHKCQKQITKDDVELFKERHNPLEGDVLFKYTCLSCSEGDTATFERYLLSWQCLVHLVLYHLHQTAGKHQKYFRWKEDICRLIEERWDDLCGGKTKSTSWANSISSVLSANSSIFLSGFEEMRQHGWWALRQITIPKHSPNSSGGSNISLLAKKRKRTVEPSEILNNGPSNQPKSIFSKGIFPPDAASQSLLLARHFAERVPKMNSLLPNEKDATPSTMKAAEEIKRKLLERLLKLDSKLLQEVLAPSLVASMNTTNSINTQSNNSSLLHQNQQHRQVILPNSKTRRENPIISSSNFTVVSNNSSSSTDQFPSRINKPLKDLRKMQKALKPVNYVRASPYENELLEKCLRIAGGGDCIIRRLTRKLAVRRLKRKLGLNLFDIDTFMYKYLKVMDPLRIKPVSSPIVASEYDGSINIDRDDQHEIEGEVRSSSVVKTYFDIPFHRDPALSFAAKLLGVSNVIFTYPLEMTSPHTGLRLPSFIHRETSIRPLKLKLIHELKSSIPLYESENEDEQVIEEKFQLEHEKATNESIDFLHLRKEWLPQVNRLLRSMFWPSIDMSESLDYPDFCILVMYKKLVIGCAVVAPDGYIAYFVIHPEWEGCGLGSLLLSLVLKHGSPKHSDLTLHVSVSNPALILYQKFGFKPEEFIVNFYDRYYRDGEVGFFQSAYSKNAFLVRRRRQ